MELEAFILSGQRSSPEYVLMHTADISRLLYSQLHNDWIWNYLRSQALLISQSILVQSFPKSHFILDKVRLHFLKELNDFPHPCEAILHLKVLVALITRNSIRLTTENFNELYIILEKLVVNTNKRLIELIFYTIMILLSLYDDYSSMLSLHSIIGSIANNSEGKRLLYALESREGK